MTGEGQGEFRLLRNPRLSTKLNLLSTFGRKAVGVGIGVGVGLTCSAMKAFCCSFSEEDCVFHRILNGSTKTTKAKMHRNKRRYLFTLFLLRIAIVDYFMIAEFVLERKGKEKDRKLNIKIRT